MSDIPPYAEFHFCQAYYPIYEKNKAATIFFIPGW